jgi:hypothetical protein
MTKDTTAGIYYIAQKVFFYDHTLNYKPERFDFVTRM